MRFSLLCLLAATLPSCFWRTAAAPPLFSAGEAVERIDFEEEAPGRPAGGFESRSGNWLVADSPTAASGFQVLAWHGEKAEKLAVKVGGGSRRIAGEVSLRVLLGASGAGIGCEADRGDGYLVKLEPAAHRLALYRRSGDSTTLLASAPTSREKGAWSRLGIACGPDLVVGYLDGKPVVETRGLLANARLALYADGGIVAHFDDLRYAARK